MKCRLSVSYGLYSKSHIFLNESLFSSNVSCRESKQQVCMVLSPLRNNINVNVLHNQNINVRQQCSTVQGADGDVGISESPTNLISNFPTLRQWDNLQTDNIKLMSRDFHAFDPRWITFVTATWGEADWNEEKPQFTDTNTSEWEDKRILTWGYTGCPRRNVRDFGRVFLMLKYTDITQNTYIQSWTVMEIMAREVWNYDSCYILIDYQIRIKTGRNMWFL